MTEQNSDSDPKGRDYRKWVETQSTEALEKELRTLELRRTVLQNTDPQMEELMEQQQQEEEAMEFEAELVAMTPEKRAEAYAEMEGSMDLMNEERAKMEPERRAQLQAEIDPTESDIPSWLTERVQVNLHIGAVQRELTVRRYRESSKGEAAPSLATPSQQSRVDPDVVKRRAIVKQNRKLETIRICRLFDLNAVPLALRGDDWEDFSSHTEPWTDAYNEKPISERRRRLIRVIISKDKKA